MKKIHAASITWLLDGESWIRFNTLHHLLDRGLSDPKVEDAYSAMIRDSECQSLLADLQTWDSTVLKRHNDADHPLHKLSFLAEIGVSVNELEIGSLLKVIQTHVSDEGPFQILSNYPTNFGGSGKDEWHWVLCDSPLIIYSLAKMGLSKGSEVVRAFDHLRSLVRENGWPCAAAEEMGGFRGPGKASAPCPYATLLMLKAHSAMHADNEDASIIFGIDSLLNLWESSRDQRPFLFRMGKDFRKLKVPFVWYDILHMLDVLSQYPYARQDQRFSEMLEIVLGKKDHHFRFTSESVWMKWKGWEFCQKRDPSRWITFSILRILKRAGLL